MPTLYRAAGGNPSDLGGIDGMDMWQALLRNRYIYHHCFTVACAFVQTQLLAVVSIGEEQVHISTFTVVFVLATICISKSRDSPRNLMLHNIDEQREIAAVGF